VDDVLGYEQTRVVVTGAASGIGAACAAILVRLGAEVHSLDVATPAEPAGTVHTCDLADPGSIDAVVSAIPGPVHSLFNCAGLPMTAPARQIVLVNFAGHRHLTEALLPKLAPAASIGFVSSVAGLDWLDRQGDVSGLLDTRDMAQAREWCEANAAVVAPDGYGLSKIAINAYVARRGFELAPSGVRLNATMPGPTDTPMLDAFAEVFGPEFFTETLPKPLGRTSTPEEQAWSLVMLNSPRSGYVTGATLVTDGGYAAGLATGGIDLTRLGRSDA